MGQDEVFGRHSQGDVQMPTFHFSYDVDLRNSLEKMGVKRVFIDSTTLLAMAPNRSGGILRGVAQKTEITVDGNGIRADSGTIVHGVYGGIGTVQSPFHMILDRPFLFLISLTSAVESQFSAFWADKFSRFNESLLEVLNSDE